MDSTIQQNNTFCLEQSYVESTKHTTIGPSYYENYLTDGVVEDGKIKFQEQSQEAYNIGSPCSSSSHCGVGGVCEKRVDDDGQEDQSKKCYSTPVAPTHSGTMKCKQCGPQCPAGNLRLLNFT